MACQPGAIGSPGLSRYNTQMLTRRNFLTASSAALTTKLFGQRIHSLFTEIMILLSCFKRYFT